MNDKPDTHEEVAASSGVSTDIGLPTRGWYSRRYLPHCDVPGLLQAITFRLDDALPDEVHARLLQEEPSEARRRRRIEAYLDAGHGACVLRQPACAEIVEKALQFFDPDRYRLLAWSVMPNHVHVLIETMERWPLAVIVHSWKSFTSKAINKRLHRNGTLWQRDYHDRYIRDDEHFAAALAYIHDNPVKAGLVARAEDWPFGSARLLDTRVLGT